jgi:anti-sigma factor (TIGR02949 family)
MTCQEAKPLLDRYVDGELDASAVPELEQHLQSCSACAAALRNLQNLKKALKQDALHFKAPEELRQRIEAELHSPVPANPRPIAQRVAWHWSWLTTAMSGAFAVCLALLLMLAHNRPSGEQQLVQEIVSSHVRSLMPGHITDVASTDQHTVKPWFNGKLDFSPPVRDLAAEGFPLTGGRLDYVGGRSVAALVFQRDKHIINLFVWDEKEQDSKPTPAPPRQGYNLIHWSKGGMVFWVVSDLNQKELMEFVQNFATDKIGNR